jgi:hypothetical protein
MCTVSFISNCISAAVILVLYFAFIVQHSLPLKCMCVYVAETLYLQVSENARCLNVFLSDLFYGAVSIKTI